MSTGAGRFATDDVELVAAGVHRVPVVLPDMGLHEVNVYALTDASGVDLIDCGMNQAASEEALVAGLASLGVGLGDVRNIFVTHHHVDHYSLATKLRREHDFTVHLGEGERQNLRAVRHVIDTQAERSHVRDMRRVGFPSDAVELVTVGTPDIDAEVWVDPDRWIDDGATLSSRSRRLTAIATPGHTKGHLVFCDEDNDLLFAGDHILSRITPSIGFEASGRSRTVLRDYLDSLTLVLGLPDTQLLPAHGPVQTSTHARVKELLAHHEERLSATLEALESVDVLGTPLNVARRLPWTRHRRDFDTLDPFNQYLAAAETAAHLDVLVQQRLARMSDTGGDPDVYEAGAPRTAHDHHSDKEGDHGSLGS
jgi:glyoxylase-like metal-dependent hydrolase (beta-lactamase superfamily II)